MDGSWIALGESVLRFHGQIEPMCFIMPDTIACCLTPRDRQLPADAWVPLHDVLRAYTSPLVGSSFPPSFPYSSASFPLSVDDAIRDNDHRV